MRSMMIRNNPLSLFEELLQPYKYGPRMYESDIGTKDNPTIITKEYTVNSAYDVIFMALLILMLTLHIL